MFDAFHRTGCGTDGDWESVMKQFLRCGLAFYYTGVVAANIATDALFGVGHRATSKVNVGALKKGWVNIAVHGHLPTLVSEIVRIGRSAEMTALAKEHGAEGIQFYGICCSCLAAMYRYEGVIPLSNAVGAELVLGTGALDLWVADVQDVFPSIMDVARCFKTTVVTTSDAARLPGAEHYAYDHHHSNIGETENIAKKIVTRAVESFAARRDVPVFIPAYEVTAEIGFSAESVQERYRGFGALAKALKSGQIRGIVNMVGCNNPRVVYERAIVDIAEELIKNDILIFTNGCASFPLLKLGYCSLSALDKTGAGLRPYGTWASASTTRAPRRSWARRRQPRASTSRTCRMRSRAPSGRMKRGSTHRSRSACSASTPITVSNRPYRDQPTSRTFLSATRQRRSARS